MVTAEKGVAEERDRARRLSSWGSCALLFTGDRVPPLVEGVCGRIFVWRVVADEMQIVHRERA
jgi:hypothetical protein